MTEVERLKVRLLGEVDELICHIESLEGKPMIGKFHWFVDTLDEFIDSVKETVEHGEPVK